MTKGEDEQSQKSALGKGLAEVLARGPEKPGEGEVEKDDKTLAQEFLLSVEDRIKTVSGKDVDITDVEIEYLQARTAFAVGNFKGALENLEKINKELEELEKEAQEAPPPPPEEEETPPPPEEVDEDDDHGDVPPPPEADIPGPDDEEEPEGGEGEEEDDEVLPEDQPMIFCMMCGEKITEGSLFCNWCGEKVE